MLNRCTLPLAAVWLAACAATPALAQAACEQVFAQPATPEQVLQRALELEPQCYRLAKFLYQLGAMLNKMGRYDEALDRLEGALMHEPDHWPSQIEYAIALEGVGDATSAEGLLANLAQNPVLDNQVQQQIAALRRSGNPSPRAGYSAILGFAAGFDDNLMGSTQQQQFDLTLPAGRIPVQTDDDQRPRAGQFMRVDFRYDAPIGSGETSQWRYSLLGSYRQSPDYAPANLGQMGAVIERNASGQQGWYLQALYQELYRGGANELRQTQLKAGFERAAVVLGQTCQQRIGADLQLLAFPVSDNLDGRYSGLFGRAYCPAYGLQLEWRLGQDQPVQSSRPGGVQRQYGIRVSKNIPLGAGTLAAELEYTHQADETGYSPLLENNLPRQITRSVYRFEYSWAAGSVNPYIGFEWVSQQANLPLFGVENRQLTAGMRIKW